LSFFIVYGLLLLWPISLVAFLCFIWTVTFVFGRSVLPGALSDLPGRFLSYSFVVLSHYCLAFIGFQGSFVFLILSFDCSLRFSLVGSPSRNLISTFSSGCGALLF
jgi:hypothetical protein